MIKFIFGLFIFLSISRPLLAETPPVILIDGREYYEIGLKSEKDFQDLKDSELVDMMFLPGLSTKEEITDVSGRGVGMDAVKEEVERLGGSISVSSKVDEGTCFVIKLPVLN